MLPLGYAFIILVAAFAAFAVVYLVANDFARETIEVVFPAVGAILLSLYLAIKTIWIDAPAPSRFVASVPVFIDASGRIRGVPQPNINFVPSIDEFRGASLIDTLPHYNAFTHIPWTIDSSKPDIDSVVPDLIEYAVLQWLENTDVQIGAGWGPSRRLLTSGGRGGRVPAELHAVSSAALGMRDNPLIAAAPLTVSLPEKSIIRRLSGHRPSFQIDTPHSTLSLKWTGTSCEPIRPPVNEEVRRLQAAIQPAIARLDGGTLCVYTLEFTFRQRPFRRFSRQAKLEDEWATIVRDQFTRDFSWEHFRAKALAR